MLDYWFQMLHPCRNRHFSVSCLKHGGDSRSYLTGSLQLLQPVSGAVLFPVGIVIITPGHRLGSWPHGLLSVLPCTFLQMQSCLGPISLFPFQPQLDQERSCSSWPVSLPLPGPQKLLSEGGRPCSFSLIRMKISFLHPMLGGISEERAGKGRHWSIHTAARTPEAAHHMMKRQTFQYVHLLWALCLSLLSSATFPVDFLLGIFL